MGREGARRGSDGAGDKESTPPPPLLLLSHHNTHKGTFPAAPSYKKSFSSPSSEQMIKTKNRA